MAGQRHECGFWMQNSRRGVAVRCTLSSFWWVLGFFFFLEGDAGMCREQFQNGHISTARDRGKGYLREGVKQHRRKWRSSVQEMLNTLVPT